jgi:hypothetical protein
VFEVWQGLKGKAGLFLPILQKAVAKASCCVAYNIPERGLKTFSDYS